MDYSKKNKSQLIEEIKKLHYRIQELETSLNIYQEESIQRINLVETSHDYLQSVIDNIADPILVINHEYRVILANKKVHEASGGVDPVKAGLKIVMRCFNEINSLDTFF